MYLMNYPAEHNLYPTRPSILFEEIDTVLVNDVLSFDQISEYLKIPKEEIEFLNPTYKTGIIPSSERTQVYLRLQQKYIGAFIENEKELYAYKTTKGIEKEKLLAEVKKSKEQNIHVVRSGESLGVIAKKYHCSVTNLKSWNNLKSNTYQNRAEVSSYESRKIKEEHHSKKVEEQPKEIAKVNNDPNHHIVANGETLASISQNE